MCALFNIPCAFRKFCDRNSFPYGASLDATRPSASRPVSVALLRPHPLLFHRTRHKECVIKLREFQDSINRLIVEGFTQIDGKTESREGSERKPAGRRQEDEGRVELRVERRSETRYVHLLLFYRFFNLLVRLLLVAQQIRTKANELLCKNKL